MDTIYAVQRPAAAVAKVALAITAETRILFTTTDPTNNRHIAEMSMEGCQKARAITAGRP